MKRVIFALAHTKSVSACKFWNSQKRGKEMATRLPEDLVLEILSKLPVKSLMRFRCVCKTWFDLIKRPYFINMHLENHSTTKNVDILFVYGNEDPTTSLMYFRSHELRSVILPNLQIKPAFARYCGPCDGLICISDYKNMVLCNPAMREFKVLPRDPFPCPKGVVSIGIAIGLGFDFNTNDYKVVTITHLDRRSGYPIPIGPPSIVKVEIYNLNTNSWREIDHNMPSLDSTPYSGTLFNGAYHWMASAEGVDFILSFDMTTEVFRRLEFPPVDLEEARCINLKVLNEFLSLMVGTEYVEIWVMHQYGVAESWRKQFTVGPLTGYWYPFLLWKNEAVLIDWHSHRMVSCALDDTHEMTDFNIHGIGNGCGVMVYKESLISIKSRLYIPSFHAKDSQ